MHQAWEHVRRAKSYRTMVIHSTEFIEELWPRAYAMGLAPRGIGYNDELWIPKVCILDNMPKEDLGWWFSGMILLAPREQMQTWARRFHQDTLDCARETMLHETCHAISDLRGVTTHDHDAWFWRRLDKLKTTFPVEAL